MKIRHMGAEFHVETQSDMMKLTVPFCNFDSELKKNCPICYTTVCLFMLHIFPTGMMHKTASGIHMINLVWQSRPESTKTQRLWYPGMWHHMVQ